MGHSETHIHFRLLLQPGTSTASILRTFHFGPPHVHISSAIPLYIHSLWLQTPATFLRFFSRGMGWKCQEQSSTSDGWELVNKYSGFLSSQIGYLWGIKLPVSQGSSAGLSFRCQWWEFAGDTLFTGCLPPPAHSSNTSSDSWDHPPHKMLSRASSS